MDRGALTFRSPLSSKGGKTWLVTTSPAHNKNKRAAVGGAGTFQLSFHREQAVGGANGAFGHPIITERYGVGTDQYRGGAKY